MIHLVAPLVVNQYSFKKANVSQFNVIAYYTMTLEALFQMSFRFNPIEPIDNR